MTCKASDVKSFFQDLDGTTNLKSKSTTNNYIVVIDRNLDLNRYCPKLKDTETKTSKDTKNETEFKTEMHTETDSETESFRSLLHIVIALLEKHAHCNHLHLMSD